MTALQTSIENIYADLKLADRMTPGRTPWQTLRKRAEEIALAECPHTPSRLHSWFATDGTLCVCCNDCGAILSGGVA